MNGHVQSLNASVAAAILMYEVFEIDYKKSFQSSDWKLFMIILNENQRAN